VSPLAISLLVFVAVFGGALLGLFLRSVLPEHHLNADSRNAIKAGLALLATMSALIFALLIVSARSSRDTQNNQVLKLSSDFIQLDGVLARYGSETKDARLMLRDAVGTGMGQTLSSRLNSTEMKADAEKLAEKIKQLAPGNDLQHSLRDQAMQVMADLEQTRMLLEEETGGSIPMPFMFLLVFWLVLIFAGLGLLTSSRPTVISVLLISAVSIASAIFLIVQLDRPLEGLMQISDGPLSDALRVVGQ